MKDINLRFLDNVYFHFFRSINIILGQFLAYGENRVKVMINE